MRSIEEITPGMVLGRYECLLPIARGGQAAVWAARVTGARGFEKIFAIKAMLPGLSEDSNFERMFLDEARIASNIKHPNVVEIVDLGEHGDLLYLVMEHVTGETLYDLIHLTRKNGIPGPLAIKIVMDTCAGLHAAHELKENGVPLDLVHRDVSPQNVMISETGIVKILDFGVARIKGRMSQATADGYVKGKTNYLSPEQIAGKSVDRRTDVFALGVILFQLTTGKHPFRGETEGQTLNNIMRCRFRKPSEVIKGYPANLEQAVLRAMEREPEFRFQTAQDLFKSLDATLTTSTRATSEDLAAFVAPWIGERVEAFRTALNQARKTASETAERQQSEYSIPRIPSLLDASAEAAAAVAVSAGGGVEVIPALAPALAPGLAPVLAPPEPIVHTPTEGGVSSLSAQLIPTRRRPLTLLIVAGVLAAALAVILVARFKGPRSTGPTFAFSATTTTTPITPLSGEAVSETPDAAVLKSGPEEIPSTSVSPAVSSAPTAQVEPSQKVPSHSNSKKNKGKGDKKWTPPVTESGL